MYDTSHLHSSFCGLNVKMACHIPGLKSLPFEERLDRLGIWTLEERRNRADLLQVFKLHKGWSSTQFGHFTISTVTTLEAILQRLINRDVILIYNDPFSPTVL